MSYTSKISTPFAITKFPMPYIILAFIIPPYHYPSTKLLFFTFINHLTFDLLHTLIFLGNNVPDRYNSFDYFVCRGYWIRHCCVINEDLVRNSGY